MKTCTRCNNEKPLDTFSKNKNKKDGRGAWCKPCHRAYENNRYKTSTDERQRKRDNSKSYRRQSRANLKKYLEDKSCVDCGFSDGRVLEFDHREEQEKSFNIGDVHGRYSWGRMLEEINKCDVRCPNCHRLRHHIQRELNNGH